MTLSDTSPTVTYDDNLGRYLTLTSPTVTDQANSNTIVPDNRLRPTIAGTMPFELTVHFVAASLGFPVSRAVSAELPVPNRLS